MRAKQNKTTKILIVIFAVALLIEVGYAILSSNLRINGNTKINRAGWDVHFENIKVASGSVTADTAAAIAEGDNTTVDYVVTLKKPGDFYEFTVDAVNNGTIDAMISTYSNTVLEEAQQKYLAYTVTYDSGAAIAATQLLASTKKETFKVRVEFKKNITAADLPAEETTLTLTFSANYVQADSTAVAVMHAVCKRATTLHTEICNQTSDTWYCSSGEYSNGDTITYGNQGTAGATIEVGDAFDCDVNGDGTFDADTERFYYVSDLDTNSDYAVLVYYNNVEAGASSNTGLYAYDSDNNPQVNGPKTAVAQLPTTDQWRRVSLVSTKRKIKDEANTEYVDFDYAGRAARMLTSKEVGAACGSTSGLDTSCKYLMENTRYSDDSLAIGYWLETVHSSYTTHAWGVDGITNSVSSYNANYGVSFGVRPAIEVPKSKIAS